MKISTGCLSLFFMFPAWLGAAEFFVSKQGDDSKDGLSRAAAFLTFQRGVDALSPGDTLTIGPGEYAGGVFRANLGKPGVQTVIRAEIPGTAVLRGDEAVGPFRLSDRSKFIYQTPCDAPVHAVKEVDTLTGMKRMPSLAEVEAEPGRWYYDEAAKILYISSSDWNAADKHQYRVSRIAEDGLFLESPTGVVIDGIAVTGFDGSAKTLSHRAANEGIKVVWGILLYQANTCVVRNCTAYLNGAGIGLNNGQSPEEKLRGKSNLIEGCVAYGNYCQASAYEASGIAIYCPESDEIKDCIAYLNDSFGIRMYGKHTGASKVADCLAWGNYGNLGDFQLKVGGPGATMYRSVSLGGFSNITLAEHCITGKEPLVFPKDNISLLPQDGKSPDLNRECVDPANYDFRLQSDSSFRGSGPDGSDRGPHPFQANVFFVSPDGNDSADGLSMRSAWKTFPRATKALRPGDTLYFEDGTYDSTGRIELKGNPDQPISLRGRGTNPVVFRGGLQLASSQHVDFQRIHFADEMQVEDSLDVRFDMCLFAGNEVGLAVQNTEALRVSHCLFTNFGKAGISLDSERAKKSWLSVLKNLFQTSPPAPANAGRSSFFLTGNIFDNARGEGMRIEGAWPGGYSDYNAYRNLAKSWLVDGRVGPPSLFGSIDQHSIEAIPEFDLAHGIPVLKNTGAFAAGGPLGKPFGINRDDFRSQVLTVIAPPTVHSVSATTANLEWTTSLPASCTFAWGETPDCPTPGTIEANFQGSISLTDLKPGRTSYFKLKALQVPGQLEDTMKPQIPTFELPPLSFTTAEKDAAPLVYYVSPKGDDSNLGTDPAKPLRTVSQAGARVNVGDTVIITPGTYAERVRIRATGTPLAPITFQGTPGQAVVMDGSHKELNNAFVASGKSHLRFDSLRFTDYSVAPDQGWGLALSGDFLLYQGKDITITRCLTDGRSGYTASFVSAWYVSDLTVKNCLMVNKFQCMRLHNPCPNLRVENCVFAGTMVMHIVLGNRAGTPAIIANNIFTDNIPVKASGNIPLFSMDETMVNRNNCYYLRSFFPPDKRTPYQPGQSFRDCEKAGILIDPLIADPIFAGVVNPDPAFKPSYDMGYPLATSPDRLMGPGELQFSDFFATNPEVVRRGIGLQPEVFATDAVVGPK